GSKIITQALASERHVYVALTSAEMFALRNRLARSDFDLVKLQTWREPVTMSKEASKALMSLGVAAAFVGRATPQFWELAELVKKPPGPPKPALPRISLPRPRSTTRPSAAPSTRPATNPATNPAPLFEIK